MIQITCVLTNGMSKVSFNLINFEKDILICIFVGTDKMDLELRLFAKLPV